MLNPDEHARLAALCEKLNGEKDPARISSLLFELALFVECQGELLRLQSTRLTSNKVERKAA